MRARASFVQLKYPTLGSPFSHSLRAICTALLDSRDPLLQSERTQGFAADPDYWKGEVFAYVGLPQNLKDLKGWLDVIRKEAWPFYRTISGGRLCWSSKNLQDLKAAPWLQHPESQ